jgi:hypothetical protein
MHSTLIADSAAAQRIKLQGDVGQLGAPVGGRIVSRLGVEEGPLAAAIRNGDSQTARAQRAESAAVQRSGGI